MANSRTSGDFKEYATVDATRAGLGYFTNTVDLRLLRKNNRENRAYPVALNKAAPHKTVKWKGTYYPKNK